MTGATRGAAEAGAPAPWADRVGLVHLSVLFLALYLAGLGAMPLIEPDEGRYAEIPQEMIATGDWVTPHLNGVLYFEKPPLYYWLCAGSMALFGENPFGARFVSALAMVVVVLLTFHLGRAIGGRRVGVLGALMLGLSPMAFASARVSTIDPLLTMFVASTLACYLRASRDETPGARLAWWGTFASAALAVLTKGLIGMVVPGAVVFLHLLFTGDWRLLRRVPWVRGTAIFAAIAVPWHVVVALRNPDFLWFYFVREHFLRYTTTVHARSEPWWYFVPVLVLGLLPWSGLWPASATALGRDGRGARRSGAILLVAWAAFVFLFFSASGSKLVSYMLPALPPLAVLAALAVEPVRRGAGRLAVAGARGLGAAGAILAAGFVAVAWLSRGGHPELTGRIPARIPLAGAIALFGAVLAVAGLVAIARGRWARAVPTFLACGFAGALVIAVASVHVADARTAKPLADHILASGHRDRPIVGYRCYPETLAFYLGHDIDLVDEQGELAFGISQLPDDEREARFGSLDALRARWNAGIPMYLVVDRGHGDLDGTGLVPGIVVAEARKFTLLTNVPE